MTGICCLFPQQIPVCPGLKIHLITLFFTLSHREGHGTVRMYGLDCFYDMAQIQIRIMGIFPTLQHKSAIPQFVTFFCTLQDVFLGQAISLSLCIAFSDTTVVAIIPAVICKFDQAAYKHRIAVYLTTHGIRFPGQCFIRRFIFDQMHYFFFCKFFCCGDRHDFSPMSFFVPVIPLFFQFFHILQTVQCLFQCFILFCKMQTDQMVHIFPEKA